MGRSTQIYELIPKWSATLGGIKDSDAIVRAHCRKCSNTFKVDVGLLISHFGRNYSLYDRTSSCRIYSCEGECLFLASPGGGTPLRPLVTKARSG
jgi:hypothetical protein